VRLEPDLSFWRAIVLPAAALLRLYSVRRQASGIAHISWAAACDDPSATDVTVAMRAVLDA
jgi:hypothetical protein